MKNSTYFLTIAILTSACGQTSTNEKTDKIVHTEKEVAKKESKNNLKAEHSLEKIEQENNESVISSGDNVTKASISLSDSSISLTANIRKDHRVFGYAKPDTKSERLLLLSVFTKDVEGNPFNCELGSYYDTGGIENLTLKYIESVGEFVKAVAIDKSGKRTDLYFEKKWVEFE